ncbi:MAG: hypothetical protein K2L48_02895 [Mycoplasmoidaceae bacterium]|nr:hypothetical protein [Mycoplasmoidaceae bacterium]
MYKAKSTMVNIPAPFKTRVTLKSSSPAVCQRMFIDQNPRPIFPLTSV